MKRVGANAKSWVFTLADRERDFLVAVLEAYPSVPPDYQSLSRESKERLSAEDAQLLKEALDEHRNAGRVKVRRWLNDGSRFRQDGEEWRFSLAKTDFDWMMQVLNDVRVGSWLKLGSPEDIQDPEELLQRDPAAFFQMEAAGLFQVQFLEAIQGANSEE